MPPYILQSFDVQWPHNNTTITKYEQILMTTASAVFGEFKAESGGCSRRANKTPTYNIIISVRLQR